MVRTLKSRLGNEILVGENAKENDAIRKSASQRDIWFHLENESSPHVILKLGKKDASKEEIYECGVLVKTYSKQKSFPRSIVIYTQVKNVKKVIDVDGLVELRSKPESIIVFE